MRKLIAVRGEPRPILVWNIALVSFVLVYLKTTVQMNEQITDLSLCYMMKKKEFGFVVIFNLLNFKVTSLTFV